MKSWVVSHLSDHVLMRGLNSLVTRDRETTAELLAHLGEVDARRLYAADACPSMYQYCLEVLRFSEDVATKRITVARAARRFPAILTALANGRLHLSGAVMLEPYLTTESADGLLAAAAHKTKFQIAQMLAERFPRADVPTSIHPLAPAAPAMGPPPDQLCSPKVLPAPGRVNVSPLTQCDAPVATTPAQACTPEIPLAPGRATSSAPPAPRSLAPVVYTTITPLSPGRYLLKGMLSQEALDLLEEAKALLAHESASKDLMQVIEKLAKDWVSVVKRRRQAATDNPRARRSAGNGRYVPAEVQRAVRKRDGDRCTFTSESGRRCSARAAHKPLEFDHIVPVARGGRTALENLRLRCRAHNQYEAERAFGRQFMREKRESARASQTARAARASQLASTARASQASQVAQAAHQPPPRAP